MSHRPKSEAGEPGLKRPRGKLTLVLGLLAGLGVALALLLGSRSQRASNAETPIRGLACSDLTMAFDDYQAGHMHEYQVDVRRAANQAELSFHGSNEFGEPERVALELQLGKGLAGGFPRSQIVMWLDRGRQACTKLGMWHAAPSASAG
jgi:hypothetical protein